LLPEGYARAVAAAPIALSVPGLLTLGAMFGARRRPPATMAVCYAALLSVAWSAFASLTLYVLGIRITADSEYWCLLVISLALAEVAQARIVLRRPAAGPQLAVHYDRDTDQPGSEVGGAEMPAAKGVGYVIVAVIGGLSLLAGGTYAIDHLSRPAPVGYTWIAWTGPTIDGVINIGQAGVKLPFQIVHQQSGTADFQLKAEWVGTPSRPLADPIALTIGPDQNVRGNLFIPPPQDGCIYRIEVTLTAAQQKNQFTDKPQTWAINVDVRDPSKPSKTCKS